MLPTVADVVRVAFAEVGATERPAGSNRTKYGAELTARYGLMTLWNGSQVSRDGNEWCATFLGWCHHAAAGWPANWLLPVKSFYTPADTNDWKRAGRWIEGSLGGQVGDHIYFDWPSDPDRAANHVGLVVEVLGDGLYRTVEGNLSDRVQKCARSGVDIIGFGRPEYLVEKESTMATVVKREGGHLALFALSGVDAVHIANEADYQSLANMGLIPDIPVVAAAAAAPIVGSATLEKMVTRGLRRFTAEELL